MGGGEVGCLLVFRIREKQERSTYDIWGRNFVSSVLQVCLFFLIRQGKEDISYSKGGQILRAGFISISSHVPPHPTPLPVHK